MHRAIKFPKYFAPIFATTLPTIFNHKNPAVNDSENKQQPIENNHKKLPKMHWPNIDELLTLPDPTKETSTWDNNWDHREPIEMAKDDRKYLNGSEEERKQILAELTPKATRNIFLIRHGQYETNAEHRDEQKLTPLGREQSALLGKRFSAAKDRFKLDKCTFSTMIRARETGQIMQSEMPHFQLECQLDPLLEEGLPCLVDPPTLPLWTRKRKSYHKHAPRIEAAFRKYFHRASPKQEKDSFELIVCHANVIRYFVCRALQSPPERWLRYSLAHASITWIQILPNGHVKIMAMGDFGHLPPEKMSFY